MTGPDFISFGQLVISGGTLAWLVRVGRWIMQVEKRLQALEQTKREWVPTLEREFPRRLRKDP